MIYSVVGNKNVHLVVLKTKFQIINMLKEKKLSAHSRV